MSKKTISRNSFILSSIYCAMHYTFTQNTNLKLNLTLNRKVKLKFNLSDSNCDSLYMNKSVLMQKQYLINYTSLNNFAFIKLDVVTSHIINVMHSTFFRGISYVL